MGRGTRRVLSLFFVAALAGAAPRRALADDPPAPAPKPADPKPADPKPPPKPGTELPLEGEAKRKYDEELKQHLKVLRTEKNRELVRQYITQLGAAFSRASRDALMQFARGNKNQEFVKHAFDALAKQGDQIAITFLCGKDGIRSGDFLVQQSAVQALGAAKNRKAVEPLLEVMKDPAVKIEVQGAVCLTLAKTAPNDPRVIDQVFLCADDKRDTIRSNALEALGYVATPAAMERLIDSLKNDKNTRARGAAATGLGWSGRKEAVGPLQDAIANDKSLTVKSAASEALTKLGAVAK